MKVLSSQTQNKRSTILKSFFITIVTLLTIASFTLMTNIGEADARYKSLDSDCSNFDDINCNVQFLYDCYSKSSANCNVAIDIQRGPFSSSDPNYATTKTFYPSGDNELKLNYNIRSGIDCSTTSSSWTEATCLLASNTGNNYNYNPATGAKTSSINVNTDNRHSLIDVEVNYDGSQKITNTAGNNNFKAFNDMKQQVNVVTRGYGSGVDLEGSGADGLFLTYDQLISDVDNSINNNKARQQFDVEARSGGDIEFLHNDYGFDLQQNIINADGFEPSTSPTTPTITTLNQGKQILTAKVFEDADVRYDTYGLSTLTQTIQDIGGKGTIQNLAGNPDSLTSTTDGMRVNLAASGYGSNVDADNTLQTAYQQVVGFTGSTASGSTPTATNIIDQMLFAALAEDRSDNGYDIADISVTENEPQSQTVNQAIVNSGGRVDLSNTATAQINLGESDDLITGDLEYEDLSQITDQTIKDVIGTTTGDRPVTNIGTTLLTINARDGTSKFIVDGFEQSLYQTAEGCTNCGNIGNVQAVFSVDNAATFYLEEGSYQRLNQYVNDDDVYNVNNVLATIGVQGSGTDASILYQQSLSNYNGNTNGPIVNGIQTAGTSSFTATIDQDAHLQCTFSGTGNFNPTNAC